MVAGQPLFVDIAADLRNLIRDTVLVAHNARFDTAFLRAEFERCGHGSLELPSLDTVTLARRILRGVPDYKLGTLCNILGIAPGGHRALGDALATAELFRQLVTLDQAYIAGKVKTCNIS
jgi:DNA polymerase III epsilon subunit-like protein